MICRLHMVTLKYTLLKVTLSFLSEGVETILKELIHLFENNVFHQVLFGCSLFTLRKASILERKSTVAHTTFLVCNHICECI